MTEAEMRTQAEQMVRDAYPGATRIEIPAVVHDHFGGTVVFVNYHKAGKDSRDRDYIYFGSGPPVQYTSPEALLRAFTGRRSISYAEISFAIIPGVIAVMLTVPLVWLLVEKAAIP